MVSGKDWIKGETEKLASAMRLQITNLDWHLELDENRERVRNDVLCFDVGGKRHRLPFSTVEIDDCDEGSSINKRPAVSQQIKVMLEAIRLDAASKKQKKK